MGQSKKKLVESSLTSYMLLLSSKLLKISVSQTSVGSCLFLVHYKNTIEITSRNWYSLVIKPTTIVKTNLFVCDFAQKPMGFYSINRSLK